MPPATSATHLHADDDTSRVTQVSNETRKEALNLCAVCQRRYSSSELNTHDADDDIGGTDTLAKPPSRSVVGQNRNRVQTTEQVCRIAPSETC